MQSRVFSEMKTIRQRITNPVNITILAVARTPTLVNIPTLTLFIEHGIIQIGYQILTPYTSTLTLTLATTSTLASTPTHTPG